ncbi:unnamed protein product [Rotaria sp. Silwood1]|nr:unnamed protein product [Rotaria sp. Silwood1]CAF1678004.1 unnamed protein product [Rotaria sp. Silwood1]
MYVEKEQNRNNDWNKPDPKTSSKQNNRSNPRESPGYGDQQNWQSNSKERQNWNKNDPPPTNERNNWNRNKSPSNGLRRKVDWKNNNNNNYSNRKPLSPQNFNDKKDLVLDKRDFLYRDVPKKIREQIQLDETAQYSVTDMRTADEISDFIAKLPGLIKGYHLSGQ